MDQLEQPTQPTLTMLIKDWLPLAGWEILYIEKLDDFKGIIRCRNPIGKRGSNERIAVIHSDHVSFDFYRQDLYPTHPDFFEDLDQILVASVFQGHQWWQRKVGWSFRTS